MGHTHCIVLLVCVVAIGYAFDTKGIKMTQEGYDKISEELRSRTPPMVESVRFGILDCTCHDRCRSKYSVEPFIFPPLNNEKRRQIDACMNCCWGQIMVERLLTDLDKITSFRVPTYANALRYKIMKLRDEY